MPDSKRTFSFVTGWQPSGPGRERYGFIMDVLIFLPGLVLAGLVLVVHYYAVRQRTPIFNARLLMFLTIPSLAGLISAICRLKTTLIIAFVSVAIYWGLLALFGGISLQNFALLGWALAPLTVLFLITVYTTLLMGVRAGAIWPFLAVVVGMVCGGSVVAMRVNHLENERYTVLGPDPTSLGPDLVTINKCAQLFRSLHPEAGYPESLQQLGPHGSGCLPQTLLSSKQQGFLLSYLPVKKGADTKATGYTVRAEEIAPRGPDSNSIWSDESGLIRLHYQGPHREGRLRAYSPPAATLEFLVFCLTERAAQYKLSAERADGEVRTCWEHSRWGEGYVTGPGNLKSPCFAITYKFHTSPSGEIDGFTATGRPVTFGNDCGTRSYLIEAKASTLRMYATSENRPAIRYDPLANMCEWRLYGDCATSAEVQ